MMRAALAVALMAVFAGAQTFERQIGEVSVELLQASRQARLDIARRKKEALPPLPAKITVGGPKDQRRKDELKLFAGGWKTAMQALNEAKNCRKFFADNGHDYAEVIRTLEATDYHFYKMQDGVGAATMDAKTVYINTNGVFVDAADGWVTLNRKRYDLEEPDRVRAMVLLHELGHQLGIFGADAGPDLESVNAAHSLDIIRNCLPGDGDAMPLPSL
jgi:hypothetical protein